MRDTQDTVATGFELDIVGNITRNLSIAANISKQETVRSNIAPVALPLTFQIAENLAAQNVLGGEIS